jgi:mucin-2
MLMRINTLSRKKILYSFLFFVFFGFTSVSYSQCPTVVSPQTFCDIQFFPSSLTIANLVATDNGGGIVWYATAVSNTPLLNGAGLVSGQTYFADDNSGTCGVRQSVTVTVYNRPDAQSFQGPCVDFSSQATVSQLQAVGNNIQWYSSPSGGSPLLPTTVLVDNAFYYCSQTNPFTGCETSRRPVQANVGLVPVPTGAPIQFFCNDPSDPPTLEDVVASGNNNWYPTISSTISIDSTTPLVSGQSYFATTVDLPCESAARLEVQTILIEPGNPGLSAIKRICVNDLATFPAFNLFDELTGGPDATGTWSGPLTTIGGNLGTVNVSTLTLAGSPYTFTYSVSAAPCPDVNSTVTIIILPLPDASISIATTNICSGSTGIVSFTGTPFATVTYTDNDGIVNFITLNAAGTANLVTSPLISNSTYSLVSVASSGVPSCTKLISGNASFNISPLPTASISTTTLNICSGSTATINFNGTPTAIITYTINGVSNQITLNALGTATLTTAPLLGNTTITLVSVTSSGPPSCTELLTESIIITILSLPTVSLSSSVSSVCSGSTATITFTGTPLAIITYKIDSNPNQTIMLDGSGQATIITGVLTVPTTYTLISAASSGVPSCSQPITGSLTIGIVPLPTASISSPTLSICSGSSATINFSGTPFATVTYNVDSTSNLTIDLNGAGTASLVTPVLTVNSIYTLISVSSVGSPSCVNPLTASITIAVTPIPTASISSTNLNICAGTTAIINFNGTPNAIITYTINSVSDQINLNTLGAATLTTLPLSANTTITLISVTSSGTPGCIKFLTESITINVEPLPTATISSTQLQTCFGTSATIVFSGTPNATVNFTIDGVANQTVLDNSGNATFSTLILTAPSIITLVSVTTGSLLACTKLLSESITIAILPLPIATISSTTLNICTGTSGTINFNGTPFALITYSVDGVIQTIPLNASGNASITSPVLTINSVYTLISVSSSGNPVCINLLTDTITIQVDPIPALNVGNDSTICSGEIASILLTGTPNTIVTYNLDGGTNLTIPIGASGTATISNAYNTTTVVNFVSIITQGTPGCEVPLTNTVTIQVLPLPFASISAVNPICFGSNANILFTGTPFATVTYTVNNISNTIPLDASGSATLQSNIIVATTYTLVSVVAEGPLFCNKQLSESLTINIVPLPIATISSSATVCSGSTASILFVGTPNSIVTYNINSNGDLTIPIGASGIATLNIPLLITSTFNLVSVTLANPPSCSQNLSGSTTLNVIQPPVAGSNAAITLCSNSALQDLFLLLGGSPQPGGTWSPVLTSGTGVYDPTIDPPGNYIYTVAGTPPCVNDTSLVTVTIVPRANAGDDGVANLCSNIDPVDLTTYLGGTSQTGGTWFPLLTSGTNLFDPSIDTAQTYTYTVTGVSPCGNDSASVVVNITPGPNAGTSGNTTMCLNSPSQDLFLSLGGTPQVGGTWSPALTSGTGFFDPAVDVQGVYTYTFSGNQPCDDDTATVTVIVNPIPDAGDDAIGNICSNVAPVDLINYLAGSPQPGGIWTPTLTSGTGLFDPAVDLPGNYIYTVGAPFCNPDIATLTVNVVPGPEAGNSGAVTFCITNTPQDLFLSLGGSPQAGGTWTPTLTSGTGIFNPAIDVQGVYTYTLSGNQPCDNDTATVTVTVDPLPNAGNFVGNQDVCTSPGTFDLFSLLTGNQAGGLWTDSTNTTVTSTIDISAFTPNTYSYTYTVTNSCLPAESETVQFTVLTNPVLDAANIAVSSPNCSGENVVVTFSNMIDGSYILNYNLSLANSLTNQNAPVSIVGGIGVLTISANDIPSVGTTRITFLNITNATTTCTTAINPNVSADFIIQPSSNLESANLSTNTVCQGEDAIVDISGANGLVDGDYQFIYSIPNGTPVIGTTAITTISNGNGQFAIPNSVIANVGTYNLTITSIVSLTGGCNNLNENASVSIDVFAIPDLSNAILLANKACINFSNEVTITNELNQTLTDGSYVITYELSGVSTATNIDTVTISNNNGTFTIPASDLNTVGNVTVTITQIESVLGGCSANVIGIDPITFEVTQIGAPVLLPKGNEFCISDNPTISNLTTNISGTLSVTWYNALNGGTAYASTDLLINNTTYFAASVSAAGCESETRLPVTVDLTRCEDILIPDGFSPNEDGVNDFFVIKDLEIAYPSYTLEIYNRYGNVLYKGNINTPNWNGTTTVGGIKLGNNVVPVGVYFYILEFNDGERKAKQGRLYLSR